MEQRQLVARIVSAVVDQDCNPSKHCMDVADVIIEKDPHLLFLITDCASYITKSFRSTENQQKFSRAHVVRRVDRLIQSRLEDTCCICLKELGHLNIVRLKASTDDPIDCGHFFHHHCIENVILSAASSNREPKCPICRRIVNGLWGDQDNLLPLF
jgi:hypothetical protein